MLEVLQTQTQNTQKSLQQINDFLVSSNELNIS